jgi:hypothetical protein
MQSLDDSSVVADNQTATSDSGRRTQEMKRILTVTLVAALALFAGSAYANFCARDVVPATTLLVPYVVVTMDAAGANPDPMGYTTYLSVTNVSSEAQIIHINIWSADSKGVLDFNQVLSGYDVWSINFADLLSGHWSAFQTSLDEDAYPNIETGSLYRTPFEWGPDGVSAYGLNDSADAQFGPPLAYGEYPWWTGLEYPESTNDLINVSNCTMAQLDDTTGGQFKDTVISGLTASLKARTHAGCGTQKVGFHTNDWLKGFGKNPIIFYVTVDLFNQCDLAFPMTGGGNIYFGQAGAEGSVKYENVLIGEVYYVNAGNGYSDSMPAVHIESDTDSHLNTATLPAMNGLGWEFMYEKALVGLSTNTWGTYEEPLATAFGFRYFNDSPTVTSTVFLWKNYTEFDTDGKVIDCGSYVYYAWDQDEHVTQRISNCPFSPCGSTDIDPNEFPYEINAVPLTNANFDLPATYGWMLVIFPPSYGTPHHDPTTNPVGWPTHYQGWAGVRTQYQGFSSLNEAATMANAHCFETQVLPVLGINYDYADGNHAPAWW